MSGDAPRIVALGESAWTVVLGNTVNRDLHRRVMELVERIEAEAIPGVLEVVPAYASLTVCFDPVTAPGARLRNRLAALISPRQVGPAAALGPAGVQPSPARAFTIPVAYDGPDLDDVARQTGLSRESIVRMHSEREYVVYMLGFVPGFAYLGDLHPALVIPRRGTPRTRVPAGSVAIAGAQTAVYPLATPGGWHLIGATRSVLFDPARNPPALLAPGDRIRFEPAG